VRVDVREVCWVGEVAVEEAREEGLLDFWGEERGDDVETYLVSGRV
jgi:hypothetical protein